ncbi:MAG TPA: alpha/beta hydrolase [Candidatus Babeliales bacterium]|nr:alpha/beta hydrolase [Candidatus Babeliales bacterium]
MMGIKGPITVIFACWLTIATQSFCSFKPENIKVGDLGLITGRNTETIKDAVIEKVVFYPQGGTHQKSRIERNGVLVRYPNAVATVLMCHGFMCDKVDIGFLRHLFPSGRFNVMNFDFRAHGEKRGDQYCTLGSDEAFDVLAAAQFLRNHPELKNKPLYVYGFSMGAVAAIEAQAKVEKLAKNNAVKGDKLATSIEAVSNIQESDAKHMNLGKDTLFDAMILDCPFDSAENVIKRGLDNLKLTVFGHTIYMPGRSILQKYAFHPYVQAMLRVVLKAVANMDSRDIAMRVFPVTPEKTVENISVPCFYIHCKKDEKVSVDGIKSIYYNTNAGYKVLWITNGRTHFDSYFYNPERYAEKVQAFLEQAVTGSLQKTKKQEIIIDADEQLLL